ncbi:helix-turn-helix domain-containing protein [Novosphingobium ovatum]|nr:helix-turn-helix domain-containing protein [Novosphingobium ovatum]
MTPSTASGKLVAARQALGLSVTDIAAATRIPERHLIALEAGDFASLPGRTYAVGFARSYARQVGLDEETIVRAMSADYRGAAPLADLPTAPAFAPGDPARVPSARFAMIAGAVALVVGIGGFAWWQSTLPGAAGLPSLLPDETASAAVSALPSVAATQPAGPVVFTAQDDNIWVRIYDQAGTVYLEKLMTKGESFTLPSDAPAPLIRTGRPDVIDITVGGQVIPHLSDKSEMIRDVPVSAQALLARASAAAAAAVASAAPSAAASAAPVVTASGAAPIPGAAPTPSASPAAKPKPRPKPKPRVTASATPAPAATPVVAAPAVPAAE